MQIPRGMGIKNGTQRLYFMGIPPGFQLDANQEERSEDFTYIIYFNLQSWIGTWAVCSGRLRFLFFFSFRLFYEHTTLLRMSLGTWYLLALWAILDDLPTVKNWRTKIYNGSPSDICRVLRDPLKGNLVASTLASRNIDETSLQPTRCTKCLSVT